MKLINFKHSIIFFNLCILISPFYILLDYEPIIICLFLILILGISHGALDDMKGKKLLKLLGYNSIKIFYSIYLIFSILIVIAWYIFPNALLSIFLIVAAYHFGKEDTVFSFKKRLVSEILFFLKGSPVIISPLLFQREATNEIFKLLNFNIFELPVLVINC